MIVETTSLVDNSCCTADSTVTFVLAVWHNRVPNWGAVLESNRSVQHFHVKALSLNRVEPRHTKVRVTQQCNFSCKYIYIYLCVTLKNRFFNGCPFSSNDIIQLKHQFLSILKRMFRVPGIYVYRYILDTLLALLQALASNQLWRNGSEVHIQKKTWTKLAPELVNLKIYEITNLKIGNHWTDKNKRQSSKTKWGWKWRFCVNLLRNVTYSKSSDVVNARMGTMFVARNTEKTLKINVNTAELKRQLSVAINDSTCQ